jgi:hypothetical protein
VPATALRRLPASTWFRIERAIEGSDTAVLILAAQPVARSAGGRSIVMEPGAGSREPRAESREPKASVRWQGEHDRTRRMAGVRTRANITSARRSYSAPVDLSTTVINAV